MSLNIPNLIGIITNNTDRQFGLCYNINNRKKGLNDVLFYFIAYFLLGSIIYLMLTSQAQVFWLQLQPLYKRVPINTQHYQARAFKSLAKVYITLPKFTAQFPFNRTYLHLLQKGRLLLVNFTYSRSPIYLKLTDFTANS